MHKYDVLDIVISGLIIVLMIIVIYLLLGGRYLGTVVRSGVVTGNQTIVYPNQASVYYSLYDGQPYTNGYYYRYQSN
jgi:Na+/H+-translocating membrane pyrophosphatase